VGGNAVVACCVVGEGPVVVMTSLVMASVVETTSIVTTSRRSIEWESSVRVQKIIEATFDGGACDGEARLNHVQRSTLKCVLLGIGGHSAFCPHATRSATWRP
jgi:hypothetical protein